MNIRLGLASLIILSVFNISIPAYAITAGELLQPIFDDPENYVIDANDPSRFIVRRDIVVDLQRMPAELRSEVVSQLFEVGCMRLNGREIDFSEVLVWNEASAQGKPLLEVKGKQRIFMGTTSTGKSRLAPEQFDFRFRRVRRVTPIFPTTIGYSRCAGLLE